MEDQTEREAFIARYNAAEGIEKKRIFNSDVIIQLFKIQARRMAYINAGCIPDLDMESTEETSDEREGNEGRRRRRFRRGND